jgi:spore germination protein KC
MEEYSATERRKLEQFPELSLETVNDGSFMSDFETYTMDQFPMRDGFRSLKAWISQNVFFKKDKFVTWTDEDVSKGINIFLNSIQELKIEVPYNEGIISFLLSNLKMSSKFELNENINFTFNIETNSAIEEMTTYIDTKKEENIKMLEEKIAEELKRILDKTMKFLQKNKTDSVGLGYRIYIKDYQNWKKLKENWNDEYFPKIKYKFNIKTNLLAEEDTNEGTAGLNE